MRQSYRMVPGILSLVLLLSAPASGEAIRNLNEAVNVAGGQRMYAMRMLKDYIMIGEKLAYKHPEEDLKTIEKRFQDAHASLGEFVKGHPELSAEIQRIGISWNGVKGMIHEPPKKEEASRYLEKIRSFWDQLNAFVGHLAKTGKRTTAQAINTSGRLRAVSQELAAVYLLRAWGMPDADEQIKKPMTLFRQSLDALEKSPETHPPMKALLNDLEKIHLFFEVMNQSMVLTPTLAIRKTDTMLQKAVTLTELYVQSTTQKEK